jgi:MoaA/NifB/PqqE/SkfB family radical SAM enzyme
MPQPNPTGSVRESADRICRFRRISGGGFRAALEITRRCNIACLHCFVPNERNDPDFGSLREAIRQLGENGCRKVLLTGGEPLLRGDLEEIIRAVTAAGMGVDLNSNLVGLSAERADALVQAGLGEASVSLYGDEAFHDQFVRRRGSYQSTINSVRLLRDRSVDLDIHGPLWSENLQFAESQYNLALDLGASSLTFFKVIALSGTEGGRLFGATRFGAAARQFEPLDLTQLSAIISQLRDRGELPVRTIGFWGRRDDECEQGSSIMALTSDLNLSPCLLSRRNAHADHRISEGNFRTTLASVREEVGRGLWSPVCDDASDDVCSTEQLVSITQ